MNDLDQTPGRGLTTPALTLIASHDERGRHVPLTKTLTGWTEGGAPIIQPHPDGWRCSSTTVDVPDLDALCSVLQVARDAGFAVVLGIPDKELNAESRAGLIPGDRPRRVLCLDVDQYPLNGRSLQQALAALLRAVGLADVNCVVQFSATHGLKDPSILKVHLFFLLDRPLPAHAFKSWLTWAKTKVPGLDAESTASGARYIYVAELVNLSGRAIPRYALERTRHAPRDFVPAERIAKRAPPSRPVTQPRKPTPAKFTPYVHTGALMVEGVDSRHNFLVREAGRLGNYAPSLELLHTYLFHLNATCFAEPCDEEHIFRKYSEPLHRKFVEGAPERTRRNVPVAAPPVARKLTPLQL